MNPFSKNDRVSYMDPVTQTEVFGVVVESDRHIVLVRRAGDTNAQPLKVLSFDVRMIQPAVTLGTPISRAACANHFDGIDSPAALIHKAVLQGA